MSKIKRIIKADAQQCYILVLHCNHNLRITAAEYCTLRPQPNSAWYCPFCPPAEDVKETIILTD